MKPESYRKPVYSKISSCIYNIPMSALQKYQQQSALLESDQSSDIPDIPLSHQSSYQKTFVTVYSKISSRKYNIPMTALKNFQQCSSLIAENVVSEESSSIHLSHQSSHQKTFLSAQEQISNPSLFPDISSDLLYDPLKSEQNKDSQSNLEVKQSKKQYVIYDSIHIDRNLQNEEIEQKRKCQFYDKQIDKLLKYQQKKRKNLIELRTSNISRRQVVKNITQIKKDYKIQIVQLKQMFQQYKYFQKDSEIYNIREQALQITKKELQGMIYQLKKQINTKNSEGCALKDQIQKVSVNVTQVQDQIKRKTDNIRERKALELIRKEKNQIQNLIKVNQKMENILKMRNQ